jgi:hypothetical protein
MKIPKPHLAEIGKAFLHEFIEYVDDEHFGEIRGATNRITDVAALCEEMIDFAVTKELINLGIIKDDDAPIVREDISTFMNLKMSQRMGSDFYTDKTKEAMGQASHLIASLNEAVEIVISRIEGDN